MNNLIKLIEKKHELLEKLIALSSKLNSDDVDELMAIDEERMVVVKEIKDLDLVIRKTYENESNADLLGRTISNKVDRSSLSGDLLGLYDKANENQQLIANLMVFEENYRLRLANIKEELLSDMRKNENSGKVAKYLNAMDQQIVPVGSLLTSKKA